MLFLILVYWLINKNFIFFINKIMHIKFILYIGGPGTGKTTRLKRLAE